MEMYKQMQEQTEFYLHNYRILSFAIRMGKLFRMARI